MLDDKPQHNLHSRPCDACAIRKVRCDLKIPCSRCIKHKIACTNRRIRKRCGPRRLQEKTRKQIEMLERDLVSSSSPRVCLRSGVTFEKIATLLQIYQTWFYGIWPIISTNLLILKIAGANNVSGPYLLINEDNAEEYALACATGAAIMQQLSFISEKPLGLKPPDGLTASLLTKESENIRHAFDLQNRPAINCLLTCFFLYACFINGEEQRTKAMIYLREAISLSQLLGLHDVKFCEGKTAAETHRIRKIYYVLLVTERYTSIESNIPLLLEATIPFPSPENEEYPEITSDFRQLVKIFAAPPKEIIQGLHLNHRYKIKEKMFNRSNLSRIMIKNIQDNLSKIKVLTVTPETQKLNILLSKYWFKALVWRYCYEHEFLQDEGSMESCFSYLYPLHITRNILDDIKDINYLAFEYNGPGVCAKILEIGDAVAHSYEKTEMQDKGGCLDIIKTLLGLVSRFKGHSLFPNNLYDELLLLLKNQSNTRMLDHIELYPNISLWSPIGAMTTFLEYDSINHFEAFSTSSIENINGHETHKSDVLQLEYQHDSALLDPDRSHENCSCIPNRAEEIFPHYESSTGLANYENLKLPSSDVFSEIRSLLNTE